MFSMFLQKALCPGRFLATQSPGKGMCMLGSQNRSPLLGAVIVNFAGARGTNMLGWSACRVGMERP